MIVDISKEPTTTEKAEMVISEANEKALEESEAALDAADRKADENKRKRKVRRIQKKQQEEQQAIQQMQDYTEAINAPSKKTTADPKPAIPFTEADEVL